MNIKKIKLVNEELLFNIGITMLALLVNLGVVYLFSQVIFFLEDKLIASGYKDSQGGHGLLDFATLLLILITLVVAVYLAVRPSNIEKIKKRIGKSIK